MSKPIPWLMEELEQWTREGVVTLEQAAAIRRRYAAPPAASGRALLIFSGLGAGVLGLGVILLLAYNWSELSRYTKLALIFGGLIAAHGAGLRLHRPAGGRAGVAEALSLLGTMLFGAGIWLVAQIYHINEHFPTGFLWWGVGAAGLAWALQSRLQGVVAALAFTAWGGSEAVAFTPTASALVLLLGGVGGLAWRLRSALLMAVVLSGATFLIPASAARWGDVGAAFLTLMGFAVLLIALSRGHVQPRERNVARVLAFFGTAGFVLTAFFGSFAGPVSEIRVEVEEAADGVKAYGLLAAPLVLTGALWIERLRRRRLAIGEPEDALYLGVVGLAYVVIVFAPEQTEALSWAFNAALLLLAAGWIRCGGRSGRLSKTVLGSLLLCGVVFARYFDLFESLLARGTAFVILGLTLFAQGLYFRKRKTTPRAEEGAT